MDFFFLEGVVFCGFFFFLIPQLGFLPRVLRRCRAAGRAAVPGAPGVLGGRFPPHTDGCFDSVERLT